MLCTESREIVELFNNQHSCFGRNPNQIPNPLVMPKLPECVGVSRGGAIAASSIARNPPLVCAVRSPPFHPELPNESKNL